MSAKVPESPRSILMPGLTDSCPALEIGAAKSIGQADATARPSREVDVRDERRVLVENITKSPFPAAAKVGKISVLLMIEPNTLHKCLDRRR